MKIRYAVLASCAAFLCGIAATRLAIPAVAQTNAPGPGFDAKIVNLIDMADEKIGPLQPLSELRSQLIGATEFGTVSVQSGNVIKHFHPNTNEIQYIIEGAGSFWLGDKEVQVKPGDLILIPKGTTHAGSKATTGRFRAIAVKLPPQGPTDTVRVD